MRKFYFLIFVLCCCFFAKESYAQSTTFNYTGAVQFYTVPTGVTSLGVDAKGGCGGSAYNYSGVTNPVYYGGRVVCTLAVTPGSVLNLFVGGLGQNCINSGTPTGGFNGGKNGRSFGGASGGCSDIRSANAAPTATNMLVVAGAGGGGGDFNGTAGAGGGLTGGAGSTSALGGTGGSGGTQTGPGPTGTNLGTIGNGAGIASEYGPGGGGYWGGNSSISFGGGGGGSSFANSTLCTGVSHTQGYTAANGNGQIILTVLCNGPGAIVGSGAVCVGGTTTLSNPTTATGGTWVSSNTAVGSINASTGVLTGISAGTTTVTYQVPNPCGSFATTVVTVNPLPASVTGSANVCIGSAVSLSSASTGGFWTSSNTAQASIGSTSGVVTGVTAGFPTIVYTLPTSCSISFPMTVNTAPSAITGTTSVCPGGTTILSDATIGGTWSSSNTALATVGSSTGVVSGVSGGFPTITYTSATGCIATSVIQVYNMNPITGVLGMCTLGTTTTLSDATAGGTWSSSNTAVATIGSASGLLTSISYGTSTISYTVASTGCVATAVEGISPTAGGTFNMTGGGAYCSGGTGVAVGLNGSTAGISYQLNNGSGTVGAPILGTGFNINFGLQPAGTYFVIANQGSACAQTMSGSSVVVANPLPTPITVSGGGNFCVGGTGLHVFLNSSVIGTNYQLMQGVTPMGSAISGTSASLDFGFQTTPGVYSVVGTNTATGCVGSMANTVTIGTNPLPTLFTVTGGGGYCIGGTGVAVGLTGSTVGVNYQLFYGGVATSTIVAGTGTGITFGAQTGAGVYTVVATNTTTGCTATMSGSATVVINALPTVYSVTGGGAYCSASTGVTIGTNGSTVGVNYQLYLGTTATGSPVAGTGAALTFGTFTVAGSYTVVAIDGTTGCTNNMSGSASVTINPLPTAFTVSGGGGYCAGGAGLPINLSGSVAGTNYQLYNGATLIGAASGTGSALVFGAQTAAGTYTVIATNTATGCSATMSGSASITINALPTVFNVTSTGTSYCAGGAGLHVGLSGSTSGVNYQLFLAGAPSGSVVAGTGLAIDFGFRTAAGSYTVVATNASTLCTNNMNGSATISINPLPTVYNVTGGSNYCTGGTGSLVGLSASNTGISYQLFNGTATVGSPIAGTGAALNFGLQTLTGTYSVVATNTTTLCSVNMSGTPTIALNPLPTQYTVSGSATSYCAGGAGIHVLQNNSATGVNYQLMNGLATVGAPVAGNGFALDFGSFTAAGTYVVVATSASTGCVNNMLGSAVVNINPVPVAFDVTGGGAYCAGGTGVNVGVAASASGVNYQLYRGVATVGAPIVGSGAALDFGLQTAAGNYSVIATNAATGCTNNMNGGVVITVTPLPTLHNITGGGNYCFGTSGSLVGVNATETTNNYQLMLGTTAVGAPVAGTGSAISFGPQTAAGTYTVVASNMISGCSSNMIGSAIINVNPLPALHIVTGGGNYCPGGSGVHVGLNISDVGVSYQLLNGTTPVGTPVAGTGVIIDFGLMTATGVYTVVATNTATGCTRAMTGSVTVGISPLPIVYNVTGGGNYCPAGAGVHVGLSGSNIGVSYQLVNGTVPVGSAVAGTGLALDFGLFTAPGTYSVVAVSGSTTCSNNMNGTVNIGISPLPAAHIVTGGGNVCPGTAGTSVGLDGSEMGINYQLYNGTLMVGTAVAGTGSALDFGLQTAAGTYTVVAKSSTTTCSNNMTGSALINVNPLPVVYTVNGGGNYCAGGTGVHVMLSGSITGTNYQLFNGASPVGGLVAGTGAPLDFGLQTTTGSYTVVATDAVTGCTRNMSGSVNVGINALPLAYGLTGGGNYCTGGTGVDIMLGGSNTGISYQLMLSGVAVGAPVAGTGFSLDFGLQTAVGNYTVQATDIVTGCTNMMSGTVTVGTNPLPALFSVSSTSSNYCAGGAGVDISLTGSSLGVSYQLYRAGSPVGAAVAGTGSAIDFGFNTLAGTYTVIAANTTTGCTRNMSSSVTVVINALPVAYAITGGGNYCTGGAGVSIGLTGSNTGILYQLYNGALPAGTPIAGTGSAISFGLQTSAGAYHVVATNPATTCTNNMSGTANVGLNTLPSPFTVMGGGHYCAGGTGSSVSLSSSAVGVNYQLMRGTTSVGSPVAGTGSGIDFGLQTAAGTYTVMATNTTTGCTNMMTGSVDITINALPTAYTVTGGGNYCNGGTGVAVGLSNTNYGVTYQLVNGSVPTGGTVTGLGTGITFGLQTAAGNYTVVALDPATGCSNGMSGSVNVGVNPLPTIYNVTGGGSYCASGAGVHVTLNGSTTGVNYQLINGLTPAGAAVPGNGGILDMGLQTAAGSYTVVATNATTSCTRTMAGSATVSVTPLVTPAVSVATTSGDTLCSGSFTTFTATPVNGGVSPVYHWTINGVAVSGTGGSYGYIPVNGDVLAVNMTSNATCTTSPTAINSLTLNVLDQGTPAVTVAADPGTVVCAGTSVTFNAAPAFGGSAPSYAWFKGTVGAGSGPSFTYVPSNGDVVYCVMTSNYRCRTALTGTSNHIAMEVDNNVTPVVAVSMNPAGKVAPGQTITFTSTVSNAGTAPTYQWLINGVPVAGATLPTFVSSNLSDLDVVCCQVYSSGGCAGVMGSDCKTIHMSGVGVKPVSLSGGEFVIVPNPNKGTFTVKGNYSTIANEDVVLEVTNMIGQVVYSTKLTTQNGELNEKIQLNNTLANGMYIVNLRSGSENKVLHMVVEQ